MVFYDVLTSNGFRRRVRGGLEEAMEVINHWKGSDLYTKFTEGDSILLVKDTGYPAHDNYTSFLPFKKDQFCLLFSLTKGSDGKLVWVEQAIDTYPTIFRIQNNVVKDQPYLFNVTEYRIIPYYDGIWVFLDEDNCAMGYSEEVNLTLHFRNNTLHSQLFTKNPAEIEPALVEFWRYRLEMTRVKIETTEKLIQQLIDTPSNFFKLFDTDKKTVEAYLDKHHNEHVNYLRFDLKVGFHLSKVSSGFDPCTLSPKEEGATFGDMQLMHKNHFSLGECYFSEEDLSRGKKLFSKVSTDYFMWNYFFMDRKHLAPSSRSRLSDSFMEMRTSFYESLVQTLIELKKELAILENGYSDGFVQQKYL